MRIPLPQQFQGHLLDAGINSAVILVLGAVIVALLVVPYPSGAQVQLTAGEVSQQNIVAPSRITYESAIATERARERAAATIPDYYDPPVSRIRRQQVNRADEILDFIDSVRGTNLAEEGLRIDSLLSIEDLALSESTALQILALPPEDWQSVRAEVPSILDEIMRDDIKENAIALVRRRVPLLIRPELDDDVSVVIIDIVRALVRPNSFLNMERTEELRQQAQDSVPVQLNTLEQGEIILRVGDLVTDEDVEALEAMGLSHSQWDWWSIVQAALVSVLLLAIIGGTVFKLRPAIFTSQRENALLVLLIGLGLVLAKLMVIPHSWMPYLFPLAGFAMLIALLLDLRVAIAALLSFLLVISYLTDGDVGLVFVSSAGALLGTLIIGKAERLSAFLWAGLGVILATVVARIAFWSTPLANTTPSDILQILLLALVNGGLATSLALIGYFVLGTVFGITTNLQLMELSRPTHPLLRQLLLKAPGTYHHTILVSNLAERAAEAIGADALLSRVGAYYHDIGKTTRPYFFAENIADDDSSPHLSLDAQTSAQIIISHVKDGVDLARKYRLPRAIQDFIWQHHGAQLMAYFYNLALENQEDGVKVVQDDFRYPGPDPQSKETAIMMLADSCEAAVRAERPTSRDQLERIVSKVITGRMLEGALHESNLTFHELQTVRKVFLQVLQGVHHPRVKYPPPRPQRAEGVVGESDQDGADDRREELDVPVDTPHRVRTAQTGDGERVEPSSNGGVVKRLRTEEIEPERTDPRP